MLRTRAAGPCWGEEGRRARHRHDQCRAPRAPPARPGLRGQEGPCRAPLRDRRRRGDTDRGKPEVVFCLDEFGPLNLQPRPCRPWAERGGRHKDPGREPRPRRRATYTRLHGVRHLFAAYDLAKDQLYGHIKKTKNRSKFLEFCRYLRSLDPGDVRIAIVCDNYSPHLTTKRCQRVGTWAAANNVEIAYTPTNSSWLKRIEAQFTALRHFALDGTDHASHKAQGSMIRRYIIWRNKHAADERLREVVTRANVA
ncbi:transposase [Streptomyces sp. MT29]|nr:transposase [Streptomyces sp. MT29]